MATAIMLIYGIRCMQYLREKKFIIGIENKNIMLKKNNHSGLVLQRTCLSEP